MSAVQTRLTSELTGIRAEIGFTRSEFDGKLAATETRVGTRMDTRITETSRALEQRLDAKIETRERGRIGIVPIERIER